jgi:hypothetical protein
VAIRPATTSPSKYYIIAAILVADRDWLKNLDFLVEIRRKLRSQYGIHARPEIKATDIRRGQGVLANLKWSPTKRLAFYSWLMEMQTTKLKLKTFAIAIDKTTLDPTRDVREMAWQYALQRVDRFCKEGDDLAMLFPDAGHGMFIRKLVRRLRRHQAITGRFGGTLRIPSERIVEDPNERQSHDSYFIQLADWNAYAAHRSSYIDQRLAGYGGLWDKLGAARLLEVNKVRKTGPPGIVLYPIKP